MIKTLIIVITEFVTWGVTSSRWLQHGEGQAGILTTSFNYNEAARIGPTMMDQRGGRLEVDEGQHEVGRGKTRGSN
jgi:hypothetical protein